MVKLFFHFGTTQPFPFVNNNLFITTLVLFIICDFPDTYLYKTDLNFSIVCSCRNNYTWYCIILPVSYYCNMNIVFFNNNIYIFSLCTNDLADIFNQLGKINIMFTIVGFFRFKKRNCLLSLFIASRRRSTHIFRNSGLHRRNSLVLRLAFFSRRTRNKSLPLNSFHDPYCTLPYPKTSAETSQWSCYKLKLIHSIRLLP